MKDIIKREKNHCASIKALYCSYPFFFLCLSFLCFTLRPIKRRHFFKQWKFEEVFSLEERKDLQCTVNDI